MIVAEVVKVGQIVSRGRAVRSQDLLVFDQIVTDPDHGRRGLASNVMRALAAAADDKTGRQALTATSAGHALYTSLGWSTLSLYSTAEFSAQTPIGL